MTKVIILDTETTGKSPIKLGSKWGEDYFKKSSDPNIWPRIVQMSFITYDLDNNKPINISSNIIKLKDTQYPIFNLHIHSKNLLKFMNKSFTRKSSN